MSEGERERELIIRFAHSCGKAGGRTRYQGSEELGMYESDQERTKVNKKDTEQKGGREKRGQKWQWECVWR